MHWRRHAACRWWCWRRPGSDFAAGRGLKSAAGLSYRAGPGTREFFTCLSGRVVLVIAGDRYELDEGDVLAFPGNLPHSYQNADPMRSATGISVVVLAKAGI